ncbi:MAG: hypothetical protein NC200_04915 [Candidatus Gastranaerophilales bacterium]|nr:hypothetical protein [Candidatus Gastranaerophilales bacterium]
MSEANRKSKLTMLLMASLITTNLAFASDYKNNVVDVKVNKESSSAVKVTIYTDKPYTEPVVVNKKANNKYVILMPETKSSLKSTPSVSNVSGTVSNVSVNTQAVNGGKGYTKIIITSEKAITVVPRTQTVAASTTAKPVVAQQTPSQKTVQAKTTVDKNAAVLKAKHEQERKLKAQQEQKAKQLAAQKAQQEQARKLAAQKAQQEAAAKRLAEQRAREQAQKVAQQKTAATTSVPQTRSKQPIEILEQEVKTDKNANFVQNNDDPVLNKEIQENIEKNKKKAKAKKKKAAVQYANTGKQSVIENIKAVIRDYQNVSLWKLLLLASAITFPLVVIMVILGMDKKINKRIDKSFKREEEQKYETISAEEALEETSVEEDTPAAFNSFEDMLNQVEEPLPSFHEEQIHKAQYEQFQQSVNQPIVEEFYEEPMVEPVEVETLPEVVNVAPEIISDEEFNNDFETEDFEHEFVEENNVPESQRIVQESSVPQVVEPAQPYVPDGYLSDFAGVNDKDFFDELVIQSMAENNVNGLPEESPADEIFDFMTSNEPVNVSKIDEPTEQEPVLAQSQDDVQEFVSETVVDDIVEQTIDESILENVVEESDNVQVADESTSSDDDLTMLTEVKLTDNAGLYLVNYDNFSSLVGHIDDDYFVIKKFDDVVNGNIILKQAEKLKDATRYLVRVGKNKMVVEVSEHSMSRLLDL